MNFSRQTQWHEHHAAGVISDRRKPYEAANELRSIARAVQHIGDPMRIDPEAFCIQKDEISRRIIAVAASMERTA
jgi:hypothetical protein